MDLRRVEGSPALPPPGPPAEVTGVRPVTLAYPEENIVDDGPGSARRLLGVFAHPDDEVFCAGGTMARAAEAGAEVMMISATRGEQGQIRDPAAATRRTLGAVREGELRAAAAELGVQRVQVLDYADGTLQHHRSSLGTTIAGIMRQFDPDTVITFGADGGYGHPDHAAVSGLTTQAFWALVRDHYQGRRLYHAVFPPRRTCMAEELAHWIIDAGRRAADRAALQAIALFAGESATMRLARDDVRVRWFPPGTAVIEQGEPADALYLILSGTADALLERPGGQVTHARAMQAGDFFGELGLVAGEGAAHVVARESLTCLVLSCTPITPYAGRGAGAATVAELPAVGLPPGTCAVDVTSYLDRKLGALARHRTQYPIVPSMLPDCLLQSMLGTEFFARSAVVGGNAAASRWAKAPRSWRPAGCSSPRYLPGRRDPGTHPPRTVTPHAALPPASVADTLAGPISLATEPAQAA
jgi:LmbE family N-acetylglucosaminyl deacetylase